jgi:hypothetical protein
MLLFNAFDSSFGIRVLSVDFAALENRGSSNGAKEGFMEDS